MALGAHGTDPPEDEDSSGVNVPEGKEATLLFSKNAGVPALGRLGSVQALSLRQMLSLSPFDSPGPGAHYGEGTC